MGSQSWRAALPRFGPQRITPNDRNPRKENPRDTPGVFRPFNSAGRSAVIAASRNARNIRAIEANVGQFAIAELRELVDVALIIPERLDHADEREQHGSLLSIADSALGGSLIVEMNID